MAAAKTWAGAIKRDVLAVYLAARDPRTPWPVRLLAMAVAAYALSPIDLIPDFIPVLGYLDDLLIVPLGLLLVVRLISPELLAEHRAAAARRSARPVSVAAAAVMIALWLAAGAFLWRWLEPLVEGWLF
ncbi:YkvA family protein [Azospirillum sp. A1-3]|uniref:YkvA family protein n=1 Tax=Azospirillum sp. A1-3 TaxID=185874 RepID=UPI0020773D91|nr:YkvA family protein [Azospirillum sp. A1-3]MCM8738786.1 YkvA family protein [Azospirillum sp. A1-3]